MLLSAVRIASGRFSVSHILLNSFVKIYFENFAIGGDFVEFLV